MIIGKTQDMFAWFWCTLSSVGLSPVRIIKHDVSTTFWQSSLQAIYSESPIIACRTIADTQDNYGYKDKNYLTVKFVDCCQAT